MLSNQTVIKWSKNHRPASRQANVQGVMDGPTLDPLLRQTARIDTKKGDKRVEVCKEAFWRVGVSLRLRVAADYRFSRLDIKR